MPYLTATEVATHLYNEVVAEIERQPTDTPLLNTAIAAAISEASGYLSNYDTAAVYAATGTNRNAILLLYTKDIAVWHYMQLANPNIDFELRLKRYEQAIKWLEKVQRGTVVPNLPMPAIESTPQGEAFIKFGSNPKRNNYF